MSRLSESFQIHLHAEPSSGQTASESMLAVTFEVLAERLQKFDRLHFEMDGSFVWTGTTPQPWQLDGMVYDRGQQIQRIELKGRCPRTEWLMLLNAVDHPQQLLIAHDLKTARFTTMEQLELSFWSN